MNIGLHDAEQEYLKNKTFPNYALMKISAYHKSKGDAVKWWQPLGINCDIVYSSKVFDFTPENQYLPADTRRGGTGYSDIPAAAKLPPEIDAIYPDYSIYPECDYAIGYITRGCPNNCPWCVVPQKEGQIQTYMNWQDIARSDTKKIVLLDNNILASEHGVQQLQSLIDTGYKIDLNQGMDARLVTDEIAQILSRLKWIRFIRFSCDQVSQIDSIIKTAKLLEKYGVKHYRLSIYLLVTKDIESAAFRVEKLKQLHGINIYAQAERNDARGITPNAIQKEFAQRYMGKRIYKKENWTEYVNKRQYLRRLRIEQ